MADISFHPRSPVTTELVRYHAAEWIEIKAGEDRLIIFAGGSGTFPTLAHIAAALAGPAETLALIEQAASYDRDHPEDQPVPSCVNCKKPMTWEAGHPSSRFDSGRASGWYCKGCGIETDTGDESNTLPINSPPKCDLSETFGITQPSDDFPF